METTLERRRVMTGEAGWRWRLGMLLGAFALAAFGGSSAGAKDWYVAPDARAAGAGTRADPWRLETALAHPSGVLPGDTIWMRGGRYAGLYVSTLRGTAEAPIVVRQMPGERATLDGVGLTSRSAVLGVMGDHTWFWGFEVMNSDTDRIATEPGSGPSLEDLPRRNGLEIFQSVPVNRGVKFINLQVHDHRQGFSLWKNAQDVEVNGCLIYYNGWDGPDRAHGHGIYLQNETGVKAIRDCLIFCQFDSGIHGYGSSAAPLDNITCERNVVFGNGLLYRGLPEKQILIGGGRPARNARIVSNWTYARSGLLFRLGYETGSIDAVVSNNYFARDGYVIFTTPTNLTLRGNMISTRLLYGIETNLFPGNLFLTNPPAPMVSALYTNLYDTNRANLVVYNWEQRPVVEVDLSGFLGEREVCEIRHGMDYFNDVQLFTNQTGRLSIDMTKRSVAVPYGREVPSGILPHLGAFVLNRLGRAPGALEAEDGGLSAGMIVQTNAIASGGRFCESSAAGNGELSVEVRVNGEGEYFAWLRVRLPAESGALFDISLDGDPAETLWTPAGANAGAWNWILVNRRSGAEGTPLQARALPMGAGVHVLRFNARVPQVGLDQILLTRDRTYRPPAGPDTLRVLEP